MTVVTSVRVYLFELTPFNGHRRKWPLRFASAIPTRPAPTRPSRPRREQVLEGRYRVSGARALRPSRISDDGRHTYIEWPRDRSIPAVYAIDAQGREALVNGMMRDDIFVIDSVAGRPGAGTPRPDRSPRRIPRPLRGPGRRGRPHPSSIALPVRGGDAATAASPAPRAVRRGGAGPLRGGGLAVARALRAGSCSNPRPAPDCSDCQSVSAR